MEAEREEMRLEAEEKRQLDLNRLDKGMQGQQLEIERIAENKRLKELLIAIQAKEERQKYEYGEEAQIENGIVREEMENGDSGKDIGSESESVNNGDDSNNIDQNVNDMIEEGIEIMLDNEDDNLNFSIG